LIGSPVGKFTWLQRLGNEVFGNKLFVGDETLEFWLRRMFEARVYCETVTPFGEEGLL